MNGTINGPTSRAVLSSPDDRAFLGMKGKLNGPTSRAVLSSPNDREFLEMFATVRASVPRARRSQKSTASIPTGRDAQALADTATADAIDIPVGARLDGEK